MKLSEAILLGSTMMKLDSSCWDGCLLGVSVRAVEVERGQVTLEQVVDWVRSVEPEEAKPAEPKAECEALLTRHAEDEGQLCGKQCNPGYFLCSEHFIE